MEKSEAEAILKELQAGNSLENAGATQVFVIKQGESFPYEDIKDAYEMDDTMAVLSNYGGMTGLRILALEDEGDKKKSYEFYDVADGLDDMDLVEETASFSDYDAFLSHLGIYITTEPAVGGARMKKVSFAEDELKIAIGFAIGGGKTPFRMPKPFNFKAGFPIKKAIADRLKALM